MTYIAVFFVLQTIGLIIFAPIKLGVTYQFSLNREKSFVTIKTFGINVLRVKFETQNNRIYVIINGKRIGKPKMTRKEASSKVPLALKFIRNERLVSVLFAVGLVGGEDAADCAIKLGLINVLLLLLPHNNKKNNRNSLVMPDYNNNRLDFDMRAKIKINILQIFQLIALLNAKPKLSAETARLGG